MCKFLAIFYRTPNPAATQKSVQNCVFSVDFFIKFIIFFPLQLLICLQGYPASLERKTIPQSTDADSPACAGGQGTLRVCRCIEKPWPPYVKGAIGLFILPSFYILHTGRRLLRRPRRKAFRPFQGRCP